MSFDLSRREFLSAAGAAACALGVDAHAQEAPLSGAKGVLDLTHSPYAVMRSVPTGALRMTEGFWARRIKTNRESAIPFTYQQMVDHGRFDNFVRWDGPRQALRAGFHTDHPSGLRAGGDSETYKWIEAACFTLDSAPDAELSRNLKQVVRDVIGTQEPSGYLNTYFVEGRAADRMLPATQISGHEVYNLGHLIQAAVAYQRTTGDRSLLDASVRYVDNFLLPRFGPEPGKQPAIAGHPEAEMAFVELYRATGDKRHLAMARYLLEGDPRFALRRDQYVELFCGSPFTNRTRLEGHAVRCTYACCGGADYYLETGDAAYRKTSEALWQDLVNHKMYITGGIGARHDGEAFGDPYELPNLRAYSESCGAIGNVMWNWRLLCGTGEARFADVIERALYNGVNSGTSIDGKLYNYCNPLALEGASDRVRKPWYSTNCCPPNLERMVASIPGYLYSTSKDGIYVHFYEDSDLNWRLENGPALKIAQRTNYPWSGDVEMTVSPAEASEFTVYLRIPGWSRNTTLKVNGNPVDAPGGNYVPIRRRWTGRDRITLRFDMAPRLTVANSRAENDFRKVAVERGPLVYCMEQMDQPEAAPLEGYSLALRENTTKDFQVVSDAQTLGGITAIHAPGLHAAAQSGATQSGATQPLYQPLELAGRKPVTLKFIPYYAFANRGDWSMQVWVPYSRV